MATTIDHLRVDHQVTILREFVDLDGTRLRAGEEGVLRDLAFDQIRLEISLVIERGSQSVFLRFPLKAPTGPRNGHMKEYFKMGDYTPRQARVLDQRAFGRREEATLSTANEPISGVTAERTMDLDGPDCLEDVEERIRREVQHIGAAASIAEMYAQRMRGFLRAGNRPRALAAFQLAVRWMGTYASWATSGGEGAALSAERDEFVQALTQELGGDPS
ncbi:MAG TPA: hypothetical protein PLN52_00515 [Opitutaceae bacterium]|nr:hypothetical protein [Opitutaceae bacterium]